MGMKMHPANYVHPGPWMKRTYLDHFGISVTEMAQHIGVSRQNMSTLLNGRAAMSAKMALSFERAFDIDADLLLRMQIAYDLAQLKLNGEEPDVKRLECVG